MSDFSPEFKEALAREIDRMGTSLSMAHALHRQITGEDDGDGGGGGEQPVMSALPTKRAARRLSRKVKAAQARTRPAVTPEQIASRQLQGHYLGLIRQFPKVRRREFQRIAKEKSRQAAIKAMKAAKAGRRLTDKPARARTRKPAATITAPAPQE